MKLGVGNRGVGRRRPRTLGRRLTVSGKYLLDHLGNQVHLRGISQGAWLQDTAADLTTIAALGGNSVRKLLRWWGPYSDEAIDARDADPARSYINPVHLAKIKAEVIEAARLGMYTILACESDCGQYGAGTPENIAYCDPLGLYGADGHNFWTDLSQRELYKAVFIRVATEFRDVDGIIYEILPEPRGDAIAADAPEIVAFYDELRTAIKAIDPRASFVVGPRSYEDTVLLEALMSSYDDIIYTANLLNGRANSEDTIHEHVLNFSEFRDAQDVPVYVNQVGVRTGDDPNQTEQNGVLSMLNAMGIHWSYWENKQHGTNPDEYALNYSDGAGGFINKPATTASYSYHCTQSLSGLRTAAEAAATAAGWSLYYVKSDLSNVFQDSAGTVPCTAAGQLVKRITAAVGSGYFTQAGADSLAPTLVVLPTGQYGIQFDGVDDFLAKDNAFFTGADGVVAIFAGECGTGASNRVAFHAGTSGTTVRYPYMAVNATDANHISFRGDDSVLQAIEGTITSDVRPLVLTAVKSGNDKDAYINGFAEGARNSVALGSIASMTRARWGSTTSGTNGWNGTSALMCLGNSGTAEQIRAVERFGCYLQGGCYRGPIPA